MRRTIAILTVVLLSLLRGLSTYSFAQEPTLASSEIDVTIRSENVSELISEMKRFSESKKIFFDFHHVQISRGEFYQIMMKSDSGVYVFASNQKDNGVFIISLASEKDSSLASPLADALEDDLTQKFGGGAVVRKK